MPTPQTLANLKAVEVSVVPRGAMQQTFLILKEESPVTKPNQAAIETLLKKEGVLGELPEAVKLALAEVKKAEGMSDKGKAALETAMKTLYAAKGEIPEETMKAMMGAAGFGAADDDENEETETETDPPAPTPETKEGGGMGDAATKDMQPTMKADGSWDFTKIPENVRSLVQALWKEKQDRDAEVKKADERVKNAEQAIAKERDLRVTKEFCERAAVLKHVGMGADDLGPVLKEISEKAPAAFAKLEPLLKGLNEKVAKGALFGEIGSTRGRDGAAPGGQTEAEAAIAAIAKGMVEKDGNTLTKEQANAKAWAANPALYTQHVQEQRARARAS